MFSQDMLLKTLTRLRKQETDDAFVEVKSCGRGLSKDVWETVSAFANTEGGVILLGISEKDGFAPVLDFDVDRVRDQFVSGVGDGGSGGARLTNPPRYSFHRLEVDDAQILAVEIFESDIHQKPCFITERGMQAGAYKRVDDKDIRLSPTELFEFNNVLASSSADSSEVEEARLDDLDAELLDEIIAREERYGSRALRGATDRETKLARIGILNSASKTTLAGLLAVGYYPQQFFPLLVIDVAVHPANTKGAGGAYRFLDRAICEGPAGIMVGDSLSAVMRNLAQASVVAGGERVDQPEIPEEVLREAIANAVVHREYHDYFLGQSISVDMFPNRIEITNPGGLWGGKTLDNLDDGISRCRNGLLMKVLRSLPASAGMGVRVEGQGSGVAMMKAVMAERGLAQPKFIAGVDYFKVVFERMLGGATNVAESTRAARLSSDDRIKEALSASQPRGVQELAAATGMKVDTVRSVLRRLIGEGAVLATASPTSRKRKYLLVV